MDGEDRLFQHWVDVLVVYPKNRAGRSPPTQFLYCSYSVNEHKQ